MVHVYVDGKGYELKSVSSLLSTVNQLTVAMQNTRNQLDRSLLRLTSLELDNVVTLGDVTDIFYLFEVLLSAGEELDGCVVQLGSEGKVTRMQREEYLAGMDEAYTLMIRDYAVGLLRGRRPRHSQAPARHRELPAPLRPPRGQAPGFTDGRGEDAIMTPLGLRTLSRVSVVREGMADKIVDEYGSLQEVLEAVDDDPSRLGRDRRQEPRRARQQPAPHVGQGRVMGAPAPCPARVPSASALPGRSRTPAPSSLPAARASALGTHAASSSSSSAASRSCAGPSRPFDRAPSVARIVVVCAQDRVAEVEKDVLSRIALSKPVSLAPSGATRQASVLSGLSAAPRDLALVAIHDAARPLVEPEQIERVLCRRPRGRAGGRCHPRGPHGGHAQARGGQHDHRHAGPLVLLVRADPAGVRRRVLLAAHKAAARDEYEGTDDASLVERMGGAWWWSRVRATTSR